jgi:hypothetical protein
MRLSKLKPRELYATKAVSRSITRRSTGPALLLDTRLWERTPGPDGPSFSLAPQDAPSRSGAQDGTSGARRGVLVIQATPAAVYDKDFDEEGLARQLAEIGHRAGIEKLTTLEEQDAVDRVLGKLRRSLPETLIVNVAPLQALVDPWGQGKQRQCRICGQPAGIDGAGRLRPHPDKEGNRCPAGEGSPDA